MSGYLSFPLITLDTILTINDVRIAGHKPVIVDPSEMLNAIIITKPLIISENRPNVITVIGMEMTFSTGLINIFSNASTAAVATIAVLSANVI